MTSCNKKRLSGFENRGGECLDVRGIRDRRPEKLHLMSIIIL
jgi:hypothetical protein